MPSLRTTQDVAAGLARQMRAFADRMTQADPPDLDHLRELEAALALCWRQAVAGMRQAGFSDGDIGRALGVSGQAVNKRWPRGG